MSFATQENDPSASQRPIAVLDPPTAEERLQASRLALQAWVQKTYYPESNSAPSPPEPQEPGWLGIVSDSLLDMPAAKVALRWVKRWWRNHPWRATADLASLAGRELAKPLATNHPWLLLIGAMATGGLIVRLRPWRWVSGGTLLASFLPSFSLASILHTVTAALSGASTNSPSSSSEIPEEFLNEEHRVREEEPLAG